MFSVKEEKDGNKTKSLMIFLIRFPGDRRVQQRIHPSGDSLWPPARRYLHQRQRTQTGQQKILLEGKGKKYTHTHIYMNTCQS